MRHARPSLSGLCAVALAATLLLVPAPPARAATSPFTDIGGSPFRADIEWLWSQGLTDGCTATTFCPADPLTRGQMAKFLVLMFDLPATDVDAFTDDEASIFEDVINRLAAAGITAGCGPTTFCPRDRVLRDQMASFIVRAAGLSAGSGRNYFRDDDGNTHEPDIDRLAAAGIGSGCGRWLFCPGGAVPRGQMAAFLHRVVVPLGSTLPYPAPGISTLYVATAGSDTGNDCFDQGQPCRTIGYALSRAFDGDTVQIGPGTFAEENLQIGWDLTVRGDAGGSTTIDASGGSRARIFTITASATAVLDHLTLTGGRADNGGAIWNDGDLAIVDSTITNNTAARSGGGVFSAGPLVITRTTVSGNTAVYGGGVFHTGTLEVANSTVSDNTAIGYQSGEGGGIFTDSDGTLTMTGTLVRGNVTQLYGGGLRAYGMVTIGRSTISANSVIQGYGGGVLVANGGRLTTIDRSTISGNSAAGGSGVYVIGPLDIANSTIALNVASGTGETFAGGIYYHGVTAMHIANSTITRNAAAVGSGIFSNWYADDIRFANTFVGGNTGGADVICQGSVGGLAACPIASQVATILGIPAGLTLADILDPAGLGNNGGSTKTIALVNSPDNPAIGAGDATVCAAAPVNGIDQRGLPRTGGCDIGAYEIQP